MTVIERQVAPRGPGRRFSSENAAEMARRSAEVRRANKNASIQRRAEIRHLMDSLDISELGAYAIAGALALAHAAIGGELEPPRTPIDRLRLLEAAKILHLMGRLELGESTSNAASIHADLPADERLAALRRQLDPLNVQVQDTSSNA